MDIVDRKRRFEEDDRMVVRELESIGFFIDSVQTLVNTLEPYPEAVPVLVRMLSQVPNLVSKTVIARALSCKEAKGQAECALIEEFCRTLPDSSPDADHFRWVVGNALEILGSKEIATPLLRMIVDPRSGSSRGMLALAAGKTKDERFISPLLDMLTERAEVGHAAKALGMLGAEEAIAPLRQVADDRSLTKWQRQQAVKAIERIEKLGEKVRGKRHSRTPTPTVS